ncbi:hypothetical protein [Colwellia sp. TT2012]|uniref:hypothetical protein n=1 Tax=Colwellia sp. TT2012 TaxID=1720342 RepID=UPI00070C1FED|nr:hypothetical protein [Colwellia sp. TT2012]
MEISDNYIEIAKSHEDNSKKYMELIPDINDLSLVTLKGHLIIEEILYFIVLKHCSFPKYLDEARLSFAQLTALTKALINIPLHECAFPAIGKLNKLRNNLAHNISSDKAANLAKELVLLCKIDSLEDKSLPEQVRGAICFIIGQLSVIGSISEMVENA